MVDLILKITKVVTTKRPCIPVAQINGLGRNEISIAPNNTVVFLNINYKKQYSNNYGDKATVRSKYLPQEGGTFQYTQNLVRCLVVTI